MLTAQPQPSSDTALSAVIPPTMRRCLASGEVKPKEDLIRFVVGPDLQVVPDLAAKLPGRGLWVSADRAALALVLSKNLFSRAAKTKVKADAGLLDQVEQLLARRCLELLGLAKSAGVVVTGQPQIEHALAQDELAYILMAADAGRDCRKKLSRARLAASGFPREALGAALGHEHLASVGLRRHPLANKLENECARWQGVRAGEMISTDDELDSELT